MLKENIDYERLCNAIGITDGIRECLEASECISTLVDDVHTYTNYDEIAMDCEDRNSTMENPKDFYGTRILKALDFAFFGKSKEEIAVALSGITTE